jgi:hypothetical protein
MPDVEHENWVIVEFRGTNDENSRGYQVRACGCGIWPQQPWTSYQAIGGARHRAILVWRLELDAGQTNPLPKVESW